MMSRTRIPVICTLVALLAACAEDEFRASGLDSFPPHEGPVQVLAQLPQPGSYDLVGVVVVRGVGFTSDERMFEQLRAMAAERGADAVIPQGPIRNRPKTEGGEERRLAGYAIRRRQ